jgi:hypothetical protein
MTRVYALLVLMLAGALLLASHDRVSAASLSQGQAVYVPIYNAIRIGDHGNPFPLASTLCIRNTDRKHPITVTSADYYDSDGKLIKSFLTAPQRLAPLAAMDRFIKSSDMGGGLYPSFIVRWSSKAMVSEPVIEGIIVGDRSGQGISFISRGRVLEESKKQE